MKKAAISLVLLSLLLTACQPAPEQEIVVSKIEIPTETVEEILPTETVTPPPRFQETFESTDGSVIFHMDLPSVRWPSMVTGFEVQPHFLTEEDSARAAHALFGDGPFYEADRMGQERWSKEELREKIRILTEYQGTTASGLLLSDEVRSANIRKCNELLETAPEELHREEFDWKYRPFGYYHWTDEELAAMEKEDMPELRAATKVGEIPYVFTSSWRDGTDYKFSGLSAAINGSNLGWDEVYYQSQISFHEKPSEEEIENLKVQAEKTLNAMGLGCWRVDSTWIREVGFGSGPQYQVHVIALPALGDTPVLRRPQPSNLKEKDVYASNYWLTETELIYGMDGQLIRMQLLSPLEQTGEKEYGIQSEEALVARARQMLTLSDSDQYAYNLYMDGKYPCDVHVSEMDLGLVRVRVPNRDAVYQYIPAVIFYGTVDFQIGDTTHRIEDHQLGEKIPLLVLNAVDGSVINDVNS